MDTHEKKTLNVAEAMVRRLMLERRGVRMPTTLIYLTPGLRKRR
jgi:hypothetical protein